MLNLNRIGSGQNLIKQVMKKSGLMENPSTRLQQLETHNIKNNIPTHGIVRNNKPNKR